jgi:voltage-gated potassium channel
MGVSRTRINDFVTGHDLAWEVAMAALTLAYVVVGFIDVKSVAAVVSAVTVALSLVFVAEFSVRCWASPSRLGYLRGHWLDLVTCIPAVGPLRLFRMLRLVGIIRFASKTRSSLLIGARRKSGEGLLGPWLVAPTVVLLWFGSAAGFWFLERGVNPHITNFQDALFLSFATATTVGNSNIKPVTVEGQILSGLVIFVGLGLLGFVSARLTAMWLHQANDSGQSTGEASSLRHELAEVRHLLERTVKLLEYHPSGPGHDIPEATPVLTDDRPTSLARASLKTTDPSLA